MTSSLGYSRAAWQRIRRQALARAGNRCQRCQRQPPNVTLVVHHVDRDGPVATTRVVVLCRGCHLSEHRDEHPPGRRVWPPER
jgi:5-methylcytosine-specific restriction endonuclease McrA